MHSNNKTTENVWQEIKGKVCLLPVRTDGGDGVRRSMLNWTDLSWSIHCIRVALLSSSDGFWVSLYDGVT